jgi:hypothetical protein
MRSRLISAPLLLLLCAGIFAQSSNKTTPRKSAADAEAEKLAKERRAQVRSLLVSLASDARNFANDSLRARSLARIADALWEVDAEESRSLFRKAWDAANIADKESQRRQDEDIRQQKSKTGGGYVGVLPANVRAEVLQLVARRNRELGEEFLEKLKIEKKEEVDDAARNLNRNPGALPEALKERLNLAFQLLENGDVERAIQFADPALTVVSIEGLNFLSTLRDKDPTAADVRYGTMLANAANDPQSDANTLSLLSSYLFTPHLFIVFHGNNTSTSQMTNGISPAIPAPELRAVFFRMASEIFLRPLPQTEEPNNQRVEEKYLILKRLFPLFEQYAAKEPTEAMRAQLEVLSNIVREDLRRRDDEWIRKGIKPEPEIADQEKKLLDRIDQVKTSEERDRLYVQLAFIASRRGEVRARDFVAKIEESEMRQSLRAYIDASLVSHWLDKKDATQSLELIKTAELTHLQRAWALSQVAKLLAETDRDKCLELLEEAGAEARRIDVSDADRPRALFAVANVVMKVDRARSWDATFDAVKAANSAEGFTGEDGRIVWRFQSKGQSSINTSTVSDFDLKGIFGSLATLDYDRAVELARGFQGEAPRAVAVISIAQAVLKEKSTPKSSAK